jgi:hypothetical protein
MRINFSIRSLMLRAMSLALVMLAMSAASRAQFRVAITFGPPAIPIYAQPICPGEGYLWTPGYWYWDDDDEDYYWVPGTWVLAPEIGFLWTPGWWGWGSGVFIWNEGFWGPEVGFYGGINYGFGYFGEGFLGGRWDNGQFFYNRSVTNVNVTNIHNVYNTTVNIHNENRVSYNGGNGGINARPTPREESATRARHLSPAPAQTQHVQAARSNRELHASVNQGKPPIAATPRPAAFNDRGVVKAREAGAPYHPPANRGATRQPGNQPAGRSETNRPENNRAGNNGSRPGNIVHPKDIPRADRSPAPSTGNPNRDQKYQKQQEKLYTQQERERQKLQQKQDQEHQRYTQQTANEARTQQLEQRHQQQTQQLQQRHDAQQQHLQQRQQPPPRQNESRPPKEK